MKFTVLSPALARKFGLEVGDTLELDPKRIDDNVEGRMNAGLIMPAVSATKKRTAAKKKKATEETAEG